jgi:MFS family permease
MCAACGIRTHIPETPVPALAAGAGAKFAALRNADCRTYLSGAMLSMMGDSIEHVISYWVMYETFHSPALAGFAAISHWVPCLFSVYTGAWADRWDCRKIIQISQVFFMAVSATWGILFLTNSLQIWEAMLLLVLHGVANVVWAPAEQLLLHDLVEEADLPSAVRLNSTAKSMGFLAGPALGSVMLLGLGPSVGILANVAIYLPLTLWLARTRFTGHLRDLPGVRRPRVSMFDAPRVLREVAGQPVLLSMVALGGLGSLFIGAGIQPQMPEFAVDLGAGRGDLAYGMLLAANAGGAVLGGILLESTGLLRPRPNAAIWSTVVWGLCMIGFAVSPSYPLSLALLVLGGVANLAALSISQTLVQLLAPAEKRGRVVGVYNMFSLGFKAGSGVTIGVVGGYIGIHLSLGLSAATLCALVVGLWWATTRAENRAAAALAQRLPTAA